MSSFRAASDTRWVLHHAGGVFVAALLVFGLVSRCCQRTTQLDLVRRAVLIAVTMLAAMFADVFVRHAVGYALLVTALAAFLHMVWVALPSVPSADTAQEPPLGGRGTAVTVRVGS
jgi:hypothetical protein